MSKISNTLICFRKKKKFIIYLEYEEKIWKINTIWNQFPDFITWWERRSVITESNKNRMKITLSMIELKPNNVQVELRKWEGKKWAVARGRNSPSICYQSYFFFILWSKFICTGLVEFWVAKISFSLILIPNCCQLIILFIFLILFCCIILQNNQRLSNM